MRCNNYVVLQSIPCSPKCKIVGKVLLDHPLRYALTATVDVPVVYLQQLWRIVSKVPVETLENPFVTPVNIQTIEAFMNRVGYQGVVDKTKINILQLFHAVINQTNVDYAALLWWDFMKNVFQKKEAIQYPRFIKLIIVYLMKKFLNIPQRIYEDYHSIKDDIPLVSVYTTRNLLVRGMLILDEFLTEEIRANDDFKEYETVFVGVDVLMNQPQPAVSTQGTYRSTLRAYRTPTVSTASPQGKKRKQIVGESSSSPKLLEPRSHKENPEYVDDDDDKEKVDEKKDAEIGSLETRTEEMQTLIPTPPRSPKTILSSDKNITQELTDIVSLPTTTTSKTPHSKRRISSKYSHRPATDDLIENNLKPFIAATIIEDRDAFRSEVPDLVSQEFNAQAPKIIEELFKNYVHSNVIQVHPTTTTLTETTSSIVHNIVLVININLPGLPPPILLAGMMIFTHKDMMTIKRMMLLLRGEKRVKRHKASKSSKSARGSSSKHSDKDSITYVSKQQQQKQEWDEWVEETVIDEDEVIPEDETPELITELQNVNKHVPTIFDRARMEATLNDMLSNKFKNAEEYAYHME
ncbi:hypothetical protein Tco_1467390 [Tanacetum coccineum]